MSKHRRLHGGLTTLALAVATVASAADAVRRYRGNAFDLKTGVFLYSENHEEHYENGKHAYSIVRYRGPDETLICRKAITFRTNRTAPNFRIDDLRDGYLEAATVAGRMLRLWTRPTRRRDLRYKQVKMPPRAVIDGGFDYFIRDNWDALVDNGKTLSFRFVAANKLDHYGFSVWKTGTVTVSDIRCARFKLTVSSRLLRLFVDPILVSYDLERRRLMEYRGMSNINDAKGKSHRTRIVFTYPWTQRPQPATPTAN